MPGLFLCPGKVLRDFSESLGILRPVSLSLKSLHSDFL